MNYKNVIHAPYQEFNTEHINHFSTGSFYNFFGSRGYALIDTGIRIMKIASNNDYDAVYSLFRKNLDGTKTDLVFDQEILPSIQAYLNASDKTYEQIIEKIRTVATLNEDIAFVGIGQFAFKLLESVKEVGISASKFVPRPPRLAIMQSRLHVCNLLIQRWNQRACRALRVREQQTYKQ